MKAKLFICHHPAGIALFKNFAQIVRRYQRDSKIILLKVNHPYFSKFNFKPYEKYFDEIVEFDFVHYQKNFMRGWWRISKFIKKIKKIENTLLKDFEDIHLVLENSGWLPINILLYNLSKNSNVKNIIRLAFNKKEDSRLKIDKIKTFLCGLYTLPFPCYKIKVLNTLQGRFVDFVYTDVPGRRIRVTGFAERDSKEKNILPYPVISNDSADDKKNMVIVFGDASIFRDGSEYFPEYRVFVKKITAFFKALENKYQDCKLCYKPHPADKNQFMPGVNPQKYILFDNKINAQMILGDYRQKIKAVYSSSSTSLIFSSFFGIPSYTFYRYLVGDGVEKLDGYFSRDNIKSKFLFHISNLKEVGKIDNLKRPKPLNLNNIGERYRKILGI